MDDEAGTPSCDPSYSSTTASDIIRVDGQLLVPPQYCPGVWNQARQYAETMPGAESSVNMVLIRCSKHAKPDIHCKECRKHKVSRHGNMEQMMIQSCKYVGGMGGTPMPMKHGPGFNLNVVLRDSILMSEYYKSLNALTNVEQVCDEINQYVTSLEPTLGPTSRTPSTLFCCLYKIMQLHPTDVQMEHMLTDDNGCIRVVAHLFLRYVCPPELLWDWIETYLLDDFTFKPGPSAHEITISTWLEKLLLEDKYHSTPLPRIPIKFKTLYGAQMVPIPEHRRRRQENRLKHDRFRMGTDVCVCHDGRWIDGEVVSSEPIEDVPGQVGCYVLTHDQDEEDGENNEVVEDEDEVKVFVDLGLIILKDRWDTKEALRTAKETLLKEKGLPRDAFISDFEALCKLEATIASDDLTAEFKRMESEKAISKGKDYARRPTSYKAALSTRDKTGDPSYNLGGDAELKRSRSPTVEAIGIRKKPKIDAGVLAQRAALIARYTSSQSQKVVNTTDYTLEEKFKIGQ
eukprot:GHVH01008129.1.p1 GENE.GHVH01008129.1~~GHVH01008129.1.p1  ORF type:complete len:515 (+),score=72.71 GHVH01008129.1:35-1579(+)